MAALFAAIWKHLLTTKRHGGADQRRSRHASCDCRRHRLQNRAQPYGTCAVIAATANSSRHASAWHQAMPLCHLALHIVACLCAGARSRASRANCRRGRGAAVLLPLTLRKGRALVRLQPDRKRVARPGRTRPGSNTLKLQVRLGKAAVWAVKPMKMVATTGGVHSTGNHPCRRQINSPSWRPSC